MVFKILLFKDLEQILSSWPKLIFSLLLYLILLISVFMIVPEVVLAEESDFKYLVYLLSIISFLSQSIFINMADDSDYTSNMISCIYKLNNGLFVFVASKFCAISLSFALHMFVLFTVLFIFSPLSIASIFCVVVALFMYITMINLLLLFANNLMITENNRYYALIVLPFTIPYIMIAISSAESWQYLVLFLGLLFIKIPIVLALISGTLVHFAVS